MKIKLCSLFVILAFLLVLTVLTASAQAPGSPCATGSGKAGRWFGTPNNMKCAGLGDSCLAPNGPGIVIGTVANMKCAGLGDSCPAQNGPGKVFGTPNNMVCAGLGEPCPAPNGPGKVTGTSNNMQCTGLADTSNTGGGSSNINTQPKPQTPGGANLKPGLQDSSSPGSAR